MNSLIGRTTKSNLTRLMMLERRIIKQHKVRLGSLLWLRPCSYTPALVASSFSTSSSEQPPQSQRNDRQRIENSRARVASLPLPSLWEKSLSEWRNLYENMGSDFWWAKIPKGFENFFPKDGPPAPEGKNKGSEKESQASKKSSPNTRQQPKSSSFSQAKDQQEQSKKQQQSSPPPGGDDIPNNNIPGMVALLILIMAARNLYESEHVEGKEITFVEFRNQLLLSGQVERVEVVNEQIARIVLRPGASGFSAPISSTNSPMNDSLGMNMNGNVAAGPSSGLKKAQQQGGAQQQQNQWNDQDKSVMDWNTTSDSMSTMTGAGVSSSGVDDMARKKSGPVYYFYIGTIESFEEKLTAAQQHMHPSRWVEVQYVTKTNWALELIKTTPLLVFLGTMFFMTRGMAGGAGAMGRGGTGGSSGGGSGGSGGGFGGIFSIGKSNAKRITKEDVNINFSDVAGCQSAKQEVMEFVDFLKDSDRFTKLGARIPKGALLCGPPGTGKTLLAKAVAGEAGVPFFSISGSDFIEMFVGVGPSRVRDLFKEARANSPCIVFIDEIDAVGRQRGRGGFSGGNDERENTLNQLLVEMDGFSASSGVVVLAGTNRIDILDQALTRPGRFDRQILVDKPDIQGRKEIFQVHLKGITLSDSLEAIASRLAGLTPGFTGADISNICNEAAIVAARREADFVTMDDFEKATDRIIGGLESNKLMSKEERNIVAYHEAGHAIAGWFLEHADPLLKVTIIPRTSGALGFAQYLPKEIFLRTQEQILDIVAMALAGRAAEEIFFGNVTTGASDDLKKVTQLVYSMIQTYGMNPRVGQIAFPQRDNEGFGGEKPYSDFTAEAMDEEARAIVDAAYERTLNLIRDHKEDVEKVAKLLLEKETIVHDDLIDLVGERPFEGDDQYKEYVSRRKTMMDEDEKKANQDQDEEKSNEADGDNELNDDSGLTPGLA